MKESPISDETLKEEIKNQVADTLEETAPTYTEPEPDPEYEEEEIQESEKEPEQDYTDI